MTADEGWSVDGSRIHRPQSQVKLCALQQLFFLPASTIRIVSSSSRLKAYGSRLMAQASSVVVVDGTLPLQSNLFAQVKEQYTMQTSKTNMGGHRLHTDGQNSQKENKSKHEKGGEKGWRITGCGPAQA